MKALLTVTLVIVILLFAIVVGAQNDQMVTVNYLIAQSQMRLANLMAVMLLLGVLLTTSVFVILWLKLRWQIGRLERKQKSISPPAKS